MGRFLALSISSNSYLRVGKMTKTELYKERIDKRNHNFKMYLEPVFFTKLNVENELYYKKNNPHLLIKVICKLFNTIAEKNTKSEHYSVLLNIKLVELAADLFYQYKELKKWAEKKGCLEDVETELSAHDISHLIRHIVPAVASNQAAYDIDKMQEALPAIKKGSALPVLLYMKNCCSRPNAPGGVTNLMAKTIAEGLGIEVSTVRRARNVLEQYGLIEEIYKNPVPVDGGKVVTLTKYKVNI